MNSKPDVSVIIAMYNSAAWIEHAIQSVLQQEPHGLSVEIIVVDDGSTDHSVQVVHSINSGIISLIQLDHNQGQAVGRNEGVRAAKGEWIQFLDSDDQVSKNLYSSFETSMEPDKNCYLFSFIREFNHHSIRQTIIQVKDKRAFGHFGGTVCNKIMKKNICLPFKPFRYSDIAFCVDIMSQADLKLGLIEDAFYSYNKKSTNSITSNFNALEFQRMFQYMLSKCDKGDRWTRMYVLEMGIAFLFDRNIPLWQSLRTAFLSIIKLYRYLPAVIFNQNRHFIRNERM